MACVHGLLYVQYSDKTLYVNKRDSRLASALSEEKFDLLCVFTSFRLRGVFGFVYFSDLWSVVSSISVERSLYPLIADKGLDFNAVYTRTYYTGELSLSIQVTSESNTSFAMFILLMALTAIII